MSTVELKEKKVMSGSRKRKKEVSAEDELTECTGNVAGKRVTRSSNVAGKRVTRSPTGGRLLSTTKRCRRGVTDAMLPPRLYRVEKIPKFGRLNVGSKPNYLRAISDSLRGTEEMEWLKKSPFGSLFKIPVNMCGLSGKLVHNLLCRSVLTRRKHELWFVFGGYPIRYSLREFAMLTGLNCDRYPSSAETDALMKPPEGEEPYWRSLLGNVTEMLVSKVATMLEEDYHAGLNGKDRMPADKRLKLALVLIVDGILLCDSSKIFVSTGAVEMVKDVDTFARYPWGRKSFELTLQNVKIGKKIGSVKSLMEKLAQSHASIHGLTLAFQLLALRCIPQLQTLLPTENQHASLLDHLVGGFITPRKIHNKTILNVEDDPQVVVHSILPEGHTVTLPPDCGWDDEVPDEHVDYMLRKLGEGHKFTPADWQYVEDNKSLADDIVDSITTNLAGVKNVWKRMRRWKLAGKQPVKTEASPAFDGKEPTVDACAVEEVVKPFSLKKVYDDMDKRMALALRRIDVEFEEARLDLFRRKQSAKKFVESQFLAARNQAASNILWALHGNKQCGAAVSKQRGVVGCSQRLFADGGKKKMSNSDEGSGNAAEGHDTMKKTDVLQNMEDDIDAVENYVDECDEQVGQNEMVEGTMRKMKQDDDAGAGSEEQPDLSVEVPEKKGINDGVGIVGNSENGSDQQVGYVGGTEREGLAGNQFAVSSAELERQWAEAEEGVNEVQCGGSSGDASSMENEQRQVKDDAVDGGGNMFQTSPKEVISEGVECAEEKEAGTVEQQVLSTLNDVVEETAKDPDNFVNISPPRLEEVEAEHVEAEINSLALVPALSVTALEDVPPEADSVEESSKDVAALRSKRARKPFNRFTPDGACKQKKDAPISVKFKLMLRKIKASRKRGFNVNGQQVKKSFFRELYTPTNHVTTEHMEAMLSLLWRKIGSTLLGNRSVILDTWFSRFLCDDYNHFKKYNTTEGGFNWHSLVRRYIRGDVESRPGGTAWVRDVDVVYVPMNWGDEHWVGVVIDLIMGTIEVLDPLISLTSTSRMKTRMKPFVEMIPEVVNSLVDVDNAFYRPPEKFTCVRPSSVSQNERTGDCGPLTVRFLELKSQDMTLLGITDDDVNRLRMEYAVDVFEAFETSLT